MALHGYALSFTSSMLYTSYMHVNGTHTLKFTSSMLYTSHMHVNGTHTLKFTKSVNKNFNYTYKVCIKPFVLGENPSKGDIHKHLGTFPL
jgi:hypothetical protein